MDFKNMTLEELMSIYSNVKTEIKHREDVEKNQRLKKCNELVNELHSLLEEDSDLFMCGYSVEDCCETWQPEISYIEVRMKGK